MSILSVPSQRWALPVAVVLAVGAGVGGTMISASATPKLPARTAAQLLVDLQHPKTDGVSGTVVEDADLGLPSLPVPGGGQGSADLSSLISGSHTLRVWYAGPDRVRIALLGTLGESDVIRNGRDLWTWSSPQNSATHRTLPAAKNGKSGMDGPSGMGGMGGMDAGHDGAGGLPITPQQAAQAALAALDPSTAVTVDGSAEVAGRDAYELVLAPRDSRSLIGQVRIAVDADTHIPLRVRVIARGATSPSFEVGFTHVSFRTPDADQFRFSPPPGARISDKGPLSFQTPHKGATSSADDMLTTLGSGWTRVAVLRGGAALGAGAATAPRPAGSAGPASPLAGILSALPHVNGSWGGGRLLRSSLFTALLTDDGRLIVGTVGPDLVYQAAAHR